MNRTGVLAAAVAVALAISPLWTRTIQPQQYEGGRSRDVADRAERNSSAIAMVLGEIRTTAADLLFIKTERYLDSGIAYMPHAEKEILTLEGETAEMERHEAEIRESAAHEGEHDHDHDHDHAHDEGHEYAGTPTIIPTRGNDFRGFVGELQRQVKPWRDPSLPHQHTPGTELLPWYRVMTLADPHDVRAYAIAAYWLKSDNIDQGVEFLEEGIANNPDAFALPHMLGRLQAEKAQKLATGGGETGEIARLRADAIANQVRAAELGFAERPADWTYESDSLEWTHYTEDDFRGSLRMAVLLEYRFGDPKVAFTRAREYSARLGGDPILTKFLERYAAEQ
ncbi:MAG: hypothetical protein RBU21_21110, partial [FCB group bacterium]|nr:hypothetical protein [FCB group bacterium]